MSQYPVELLRIHHVMTPFTYFPFLAESIICELAADGLCVSLQLTHSNWLLRLCSPLQPVNHAILRRSCLSPHPDERHLAGWQQEDWILCAQKCCTKKEIACVQQSRCWERGDWVVLVIGTSPPVLSPFVSRLVVACNHGDSWSCYLLRGRGGGARDFEAWVTSLCGWSEDWGGRGGTLHKDHTVLFTSIHCLDSHRRKRDQ